MSLTLEDQYNLAVSTWHTGDFDLLARLLEDPSSISPVEHQAAAESLGVKGDFLSGLVNFATDPMVLVAAFLSRKFPTSQYLRGVMPNRFIGTNNQFTGLSSITRTVEGFFRGTNVSRLLALKMKRETEVMNVGNKIFGLLENRPNWKNEMETVSLLLEGRNPGGATPELRDLSGKIRVHMNDLWDNFLSKTWKIQGGFTHEKFATYSTAKPFPVHAAPKYLRDYLPHLPLIGEESLIQTSGIEAIAQMKKSQAAEAIRLAGIDPANIWKREAAGRVAANFHNYQNFMTKTGGQVFNPRLFKRVRLNANVNEQGLFVTDLNVILQKYIHSVARTYSLNAPLTPRERLLAMTKIEGPSGQIIQQMPSELPIAAQIMNEGLGAVSSGRRIRANIPGTNTFVERPEPGSINAPGIGALKSLMRSVMGKRDESEILFGGLYSTIRSKVSSIAQTLGKKKTAQIEGAISSMENQYQTKGLQDRVVSYFYATTLGLNPLSTLKNLFQPALTTAPSIGIGPTLEGYKVLKNRLPLYVNTFLKNKRRLSARKVPAVERLNLAQEEAFNEVFPELARFGIRADPRAFELNERALILDSGKPKFRNFDSYAKFLLQPFTQAELSNQVVTFYGAKAALRRDLRTGALDIPSHAGVPRSAQFVDDFLNEQAAGIVASTQFRPGPGSKTVLQSHIPSSFRMFTSFPIRLANHFAESTVRGALTAKQLETASRFERLTGGRNLGTLARTFLIGKGLNDGLRESIGVDMSDAMGIIGPFSAPDFGQAFYPLPLSPIPGTALGIVTATVTRDIKKLQPMILPGGREIPIPKSLVPGGIAASRVFKAINAYEPELGGFVDEDRRLMFKGGTQDFIMSMLGIPLDKDRRMHQDIDIMHANRTAQSRIRRRYLIAASNYDTGSMNQLQKLWKKRFPELGSLQVDRQDKRRYDESRRMTSVQRMIENLGKKSSYLEGRIYETDPDLIAEPVNFGGF